MLALLLLASSFTVPPPGSPSRKAILEALRPAVVSSFLNFNLKGTDRKTNGFHDRQQWGLALDGALNIDGVVLEGSAFGEVSEAAALDRGDVRLVYDLPQRALRLMAGDLSYPVVGY